LNSQGSFLEVIEFFKLFQTLEFYITCNLMLSTD